MKLWLLCPNDKYLKIGAHPEIDNPWDPWYDKAFGFVIRAESESEARRIAQNGSGTESDDGPVWLSSEYSTCQELRPTGPAGCIIRDVARA